MAQGGTVSLMAALADRVLGPRIPDDELPHPVPPGVVVRRSRLIPAIGGVFMGGSRRPAGAVTLGHTILCNEGQTLTDDLLVHELVHVEQWEKDPLFALKYCAEWFRHGYRQNPYEQDAYARQREYAARKHQSVPPRPL